MTHILDMRHIFQWFFTSLIDLNHITKRFYPFTLSNITFPFKTFQQMGNVVTIRRGCSGSLHHWFLFKTFQATRNRSDNETKLALYSTSLDSTKEGRQKWNPKLKLTIKSSIFAFQLSWQFYSMKFLWFTLFQRFKVVA